MILLPTLAMTFFSGTLFYSFVQESMNSNYVDHKILNITGLVIPWTLLIIFCVWYVQTNYEECGACNPTAVVDTSSITHQIDSLQSIINQHRNK